MFRVPPFLSPGDHVAVVATARAVHQESVEYALGLLKSWGLHVHCGTHLFDTDQMFAGTDQQRGSDLQQALDDPSIKAIFCARGGYGTTRIIDDINWDQFKQNPKWVCGFSDITALLSHIHSMGIACIHGPMPQLFQKGSPSGDVANLQEFLFHSSDYTVKAKAHPSNRAGKAKGIVVGGNLSILVHLLGSDTELDTSNKILLLEEVDEYQYAVDRMMVQLKRSGRLEKLAAVVVGHLTKIKVGDLSFNQSIEDTMKQHLPSDIPVAFGLPFGHEHPNFVCPLGLEARLQVGQDGVNISF